MEVRPYDQIYSITTVFITTCIALANTITEDECLSMMSSVVVENVGCFVAYHEEIAMDYQNAEQICYGGLGLDMMYGGRLAVLNTNVSFNGVIRSDIFDFTTQEYYHIGLEKQSGLIFNSSSFYTGWQWYDSLSDNNNVVNLYDHFTTEGAKFGNNFQAVNTSGSLRGYLIVSSHRLPDDTVLYKNNLVDYEAFPEFDRLGRSYGGVLCEYPLTSLTTTTTTTSTMSLTSISVTTSTTANDIMASTTQFTTLHPITLAATSAKITSTTNTPTLTEGTTGLSSIVPLSLETLYKRLSSAARFRPYTRDYQVPLVSVCISLTQ